MTRSRIIGLGLAFAMGIGIAALPKTSTAAPAPMGYGQDWDSWGARGLKSHTELQGYHQGLGEARKDFASHRHMDPDAHNEYRNPPVPPELAEEFRAGFMRGYSVAMSQLEGDPAWTAFKGAPETWQPPSAWTEWKRRGFHDGIEGARKDYGNNRRADPNNRDEYRNPHVPAEFRDDYRAGFRRGYEAAASRLYGGM